MAGTRIFSVKIDPLALAEAADSLNGLDGDALRAIATKAVNDATDATYDSLLAAMRQGGINLTQQQIEKRLVKSLDQGKGPQARASIKALHSASPLASYGAQMPTTQVNWSNDRITAMGHTFGKWPGWTKRVGRPNVGIAADQKAAAGVSVEVVKGNRRTLKHAFLFQGKNGNLLLAVRGKNGARGAYTVLYGPSVTQLMRHQLDTGDIIPLVEKLLADYTTKGFLDAIAD